MQGPVFDLFMNTLANVIAASISAGTGSLLHHVKDPSQEKTLADIMTRSLGEAFVDARLEGGTDEEWIREVAAQWIEAFTPAVVSSLLDCLISTRDGASEEFSIKARIALIDSGCDLQSLEHLVWTEQFLHVLRERFWGDLVLAAREQPHIRSLVSLMLTLRADALSEATGAVSSPRQYRADLKALMQHLVDDARTGRIPSYLSPVDIMTLNRQVFVRDEIRRPRPLAGQSGGDTGKGRAYLLPVDYAGREDVKKEPLLRLWRELADDLTQVVVLSDPGLGKSWLIRTETLRHAKAALAKLDTENDPASLVIPIPLRCDQLAASVGDTLGEAAADHFVRMCWIDERSRSRLAGQIDAGHAHLLADAYDELPTREATHRFRQLLAGWTDSFVDRRWLLTSRIAGYVGPPVSGAQEIELQALTPSEVIGLVRAWGLSIQSEDRILSALDIPAVAGMARVPLLLALLCSLAGDMPSGEDLPTTKDTLYERVLRWFLARPHRSLDVTIEHSPGSGIEGLLEVLAPTAYRFAAENDGWRDLISRDNLIKAFRSAGPAFDELGLSGEELLDELSVGAGVLVPDGDMSRGRNPRYLFLHRTFAEYLTARHISGLPEADRLNILEAHLWFDPAWTEVISMLGGMLGSEEAQQFFQWVTTRHDDPFYQALLMGARILAEREDRDSLLAPMEAESYAATILWLLKSERYRDPTVTVLLSVPSLTSKVIRRLIELLEDVDPKLRHAALRILGSHSFLQAEEHIVARLTDDDPKIRQVAVELIAERKSHLDFPALVARLGDQDAKVRLSAATALGRYPMLQLSTVVSAHLGSTEDDLRVSALQILAANETTSMLDPFLRALTDQSELVRLAAVKALDGHSDAQVVKGLTVCLADTEETVQIAALEALSSTSCDAPEFISAYMSMVVDNPDSTQILNPPLVTNGQPAIVNELLSRLSSNIPSQRQRAATLLAKMRPQGVKDRLLTLLTAHEASHRQAAAQASAGQQDTYLIQQLLIRLTDEQPEVRQAALEALIASDVPQVADFLVACLRDSEPGVRRVAAEASVNRVARGLTNALVACVSDGDQPMVLLAVITALRERVGSDVTKALRKCLENDEFGLLEWVWDAAAHAMNSRDSAAVLRALAPHISSDNPYRQRAAASALAYCDAPGTVAVLLSIIETGTRKGRIAASWALSRRDAPRDLISAVENLPDLSPAAQQYALFAFKQLATRHYMRLPKSDRARVRSVLGGLTLLPPESQ